jgi:signal transduction histidine kinase
MHKGCSTVSDKYSPHSNRGMTIEYWNQPSHDYKFSPLAFIPGKERNPFFSNRVNREQTSQAVRLSIGRLIEAQEEERRRLARELHDGLSQQLAMLTVELGRLAHQFPGSNPVLLEQLAKLQVRATEISDDLRCMTHDLHPAVLEHLGLIPALRSYCADFSQAEGIRVRFQNFAGTESVPPEVTLCLYRITQEALRNVAKHSQALESWVEIEHDDKEIRLRITDQGVGFDWEALPPGGMGLVSMRERAQLLSGTVMINSVPGRGTSVDVRVPIKLRQQKMNPGRSYAKSKDIAG